VGKKVKQPEIFNVTECFGNLVILPASTWTSHILDEHPEMDGFENLVRNVLRDPEEVRLGSHDMAAVFLSGAGEGPGAQGIRVVVNYDAADFEKGATTGLVATSYPVDFVAYPNPRMGRTLLKKQR
jgi:hypothetical protein